MCCITGLCVHPTDGPIVIKIHPENKFADSSDLQILLLLIHFILDCYINTLLKYKRVCEFVYELTELIVYNLKKMNTWTCAINNYNTPPCILVYTMYIFFHFSNENECVCMCVRVRAFTSH